MKTKKMKKQAWVTGIAINEPKRSSLFESVVKRLGLSLSTPGDDLSTWVEKNLESWGNSKELKIWVTKNYNFRYVPERLLRMWNLCPIWEDEELRWETSTVPASTTKAKHEPGYYSNYDDNDAWTGTPL